MGQWCPTLWTLAWWTIMWCLVPKLIPYKTSRGALYGSSRPPIDTPPNPLKPPSDPPYNQFITDHPHDDCSHLCTIMMFDIIRVWCDHHLPYTMQSSSWWSLIVIICIQCDHLYKMWSFVCCTSSFVNHAIIIMMMIVIIRVQCNHHHRDDYHHLCMMRSS